MGIDAYGIPGNKLHNPREELTHAAKEDEHPDHGIWGLDAAGVQAVDGYEEDVFSNLISLSFHIFTFGRIWGRCIPAANEISPSGVGLAKLRCTTGRGSWERSLTWPPAVRRRSRWLDEASVSGSPALEVPGAKSLVEDIAEWV
jgi:hypothetical protein